MPPANSPVAPSPELHAEQRAASPSTYIPALRELGSPVLDLASTLTVQGDDGIDPNNVGFLRAPVEPLDDDHAETLDRNLQAERRRSTRLQEQRERSLSEEARERRLHEHRMLYLRHRSEMNDLWEGASRNTGSSREQSRAAYGDRVPNSQSLYDWAPASEEGDEDELEDILHELRYQNPNTSVETLRAQYQSQYDREPESRYRWHSSRFLPGQAPQGHEPSLRSAAILQSVRRNYRFSARSRDLMQRYVMDRERSANQQSDDGERSSSTRWPRDNPSEGSRYEFNRLAWQAQQRPAAGILSSTREPIDSYRRRYLEDPSTKPSDFEKAIKNLHIICSSMNDEERVLTALDNDFLTKEGLKEFIETFALCPNPITSPQPSSWLAAGVSFCGFQHAHHPPILSSGATLSRLTNNRNAISNVAVPNLTPSEATRPWLGNTLTSSPQPQNSTRLATSTTPSSTSPLSHDRWAVKVAIHTVDYAKMTLSGTMEAFTVKPSTALSQLFTASENPNPPNTLYETPSQPPTPPTSTAFSPILTPAKPDFSTFLEGEIIDFTTHTLATQSFPASTHSDATYWRKLEPFRNLPDDTRLGRNLLSRNWIEQELVGKYVLMRWKERCFVKPTGRPTTITAPSYGVEGTGEEQAVPDLAERQHLSISGFYYISLRRKDGWCEGLYCEPGGSPHQHLELRPERLGRLGLASSALR